MPLSLVDLVYLPMLDINKPTDIPIRECDCVSVMLDVLPI